MRQNRNQEAAALQFQVFWDTQHHQVRGMAQQALPDLLRAVHDVHPGVQDKATAASHYVEPDSESGASVVAIDIAELPAARDSPEAGGAGGAPLAGGPDRRALLCQGYPNREKQNRREPASRDPRRPRDPRPDTGRDRNRCHWLRSLPTTSSSFPTGYDELSPVGFTRRRYLMHSVRACLLYTSPSPRDG